MFIFETSVLHCSQEVFLHHKLSQQLIPAGIAGRVDLQKKHFASIQLVGTLVTHISARAVTVYIQVLVPK